MLLDAAERAVDVADVDALRADERGELLDQLVAVRGAVAEQRQQARARGTDGLGRASTAAHM